MKLKQIIKISILFSILFLTQLGFAKPESKKTIQRKPSQDLTSQYVEEALQKPHNCRVIVRYLYHSETEKIEIMPFIVKTEAECKDTAKLFEPILDDKIKNKNVTYLWMKGFPPK